MNQPTPPAPSFSVISGAQVAEVISGNEEQVTRIIEAAYRLHGEGLTVNPDSYFLTFPDRPSSRIIALPASVKGDVDVHGIKWISSFPENVAAGLPRASAVLILNDVHTGYPFACLESSVISAARTAASAALAAAELSKQRGGRPARVGFIGTGLIARFIHTYLAGTGWAWDELGVHDLSAEHAKEFGRYLGRTEDGTITIHETAEELIRSSDLIVFATVAGQPHVTEPSWFAHNPLVLHISLRDLSPEIVLVSHNITDDVEHCMKANTSLHLTEQLVGNRDFVTGTLFDVLEGRAACPPDRPVVFSPFGLGVLDLAVAKYIHARLAGDGALHTVPDFFTELKRYG
ncbi:2,3-diaminopropionate biosynthesis protein SbnB [Streptomyces antarcticus]|uniref:2,3-diaminopropionate biosynthesis protein SbnB n=1 Tax=Streptomyces antarcticus TaxID=2996458 RepID=UPI00227124AE|nr:MULTISPECIES: 2,3-diaminopropionate biosynthesis protein SbnB [unclassified Streptomyces]MCY0941372.1 2,3-diaminopropionate biosynthesis protein SbnB [Streptomyces sp. H34-AA3]MCZ4086068.1 2,3-diaminopropionate biosynthesis protein SbnB [Streptomyces sp. H34-S5]